MTRRWTAADIDRSNARVRGERQPKAAQKRVQGRGKRKPTPVLVPVNGVLHIGSHRYAWWHWRQAYVCPCGMWVSGETLKRLEAT